MSTNDDLTDTDAIHVPLKPYFPSTHYYNYNFAHMIRLYPYAANRYKRIHRNRIIQTRHPVYGAQGTASAWSCCFSFYTQHAAVHANSYKFTLDLVVAVVVTTDGCTGVSTVAFAIP